jgi:anti-sigma factor RsiW
MTQETQHLEFLISQYVDNVLDAPNRKFVEQQLAADPAARDLLKQHREAQDLLDDYGSRLPLINWNEFDAALAAKLDAETGVPRRIAAWQRWARPVAAAAALTLAASLGYGWHAYTLPPQKVAVTPAPAPVVTPDARVAISDRPAPTGSIGNVTVTDVPTPRLPEQTVTIYPGSASPTPTGSLPGGVRALSNPTAQADNRDPSLIH